MCHFDFKFVAFDFSNNNFDFQNLSRLIFQMTLLISKIHRVWFLKRTLLISKICRVWFLKWHFWFPKFIGFDFSNDTSDFQNLARLISQMTLLISKISRVWFFKWHFDFQNFASLPAGGSPLVWWVYTWPFALLFFPRVWLPFRAKEFVKMLRSVIEFSH